MHVFVSLLLAKIEQNRFCKCWLALPILLERFHRNWTGGMGEI
jgi:hypothetical protein